MPDVDLPLPCEAYIGDEPFIFVSYSHKDGHLVFDEILRLDAGGYRIWYDEGIDPGNEWPDEIAAAINRSAFFLVYITANAVDSANVRNEINFALNRHKPFLAIHLTQTDLTPGLEMRMGDIQAVLRYRMNADHYYRKIEKSLPKELKRKVSSVPHRDHLKTALHDVFIGYSHFDKSFADSESKFPERPLRENEIETASDPHLLVPDAGIKAPLPGLHALTRRLLSPGESPSRPYSTSRKLLTFASCAVTALLCIFGMRILLHRSIAGSDEHPVFVQSTKSKQNPIDGAEMIWIPPGEFLMGDDDQKTNRRRIVSLPGYWIYKNLVTVGMYEKFCRKTHATMPDAPTFNRGWARRDLPMVNIMWGDALAYSNWAGVSLPSNEQWEKAARGTDGRRFPWKGKFDVRMVWSGHRVHGTAAGTAPVGKYGISPYLCTDMAGNVWEWNANWHRADYGEDDVITDALDPAGIGYEPIVAGGSWTDFSEDLFRTSYRREIPECSALAFVGFRCAVGD